MRNYNKCILLILISLLILNAPVLNAARPGLWETSEIQDWLEGEFNNTGLTSEGSLIATFPTNEIQLRSKLAWESLRINEQIIVGASLPSAVYKISSDLESEKLLQTEDLGFTALAKFNGGVYLANTPSGDIYRYSPESESLEKVASISDSYIWSMTPDPEENTLFIGSGPNGRLYKMNQEHTITKLDQTSGNNIMSISFFNNQLYVGDDEGGIYQFDRDSGMFESFFGFSNGEVSALTSDDQFLYLAINHRQQSMQEKKEQKKRSNLAKKLRKKALRQRIQTNQVGPLKKGASETGTRKKRVDQSNILLKTIRQKAQNTNSSIFSGLSGTIVYRMNPPGQMNIVYNDKQEIVHDLESDGENLYVATGGKGRLYKIKPDFTRIAFFKSSQELILDVNLKGGKPSTISTGEGAATFIPASEKQQATYRSSPFDAHLLARWGKITLAGTANPAIRTRSGNTKKPGEQWSDWSDWKTGKKISVVTEPARYLQYEVKINNKNASINSVEMAYQIPNQRPRIADLKVSPNPIHQSLMNTPKGNNNDNPNGSSQRRPTPNGFALNKNITAKRQIKWKAIDPDGDPIVSQVFYKPLDGEKWISLTNGEYSTQQKFNLKTQTLADGRYLFKVIVTDKPFNDPQRAFSTHKISSPVLIDNSQPTVENLKIKEDSISFQAKDKTSRIMLSQFRIDGDRWQALIPEDGIFDESKESFEVNLDERLQSGDLLEIRILDEGGNTHQTKQTIQ